MSPEPLPSSRIDARLRAAVADIVPELLQLVALLQRHRGMRAARLAGDESFSDPLAAHRDQVADSLPVLRSALARHDPAEGLALATLCEGAWSTLAADPVGTPALDFARHTAIVDVLLVWLRRFTQRCQVPAAVMPGEQYVLHNLAVRLPMLAELLAQVRGLGAGVAARGACPEQTRVRLLFLLARAESLLAQVAGEPGALAEAANLALSLESLAGTVRADMLVADGVRMGAPNYFTLASGVVDGVFAWIDLSRGRLLAGT